VHPSSIIWQVLRGLLVIIAGFGFWNGVMAQRAPQTGQIQLVTRAETGAQGNHHSGYPAPSADGSWVAFWSVASNLVPNDTNNFADIFVRNEDLNITERVSVSTNGVQANFHSGGIFYGFPSISGDGQKVVFQSRASNLVADDTNNSTDIFHHDRTTGITRRVSVSSSGVEGDQESITPTLSADGRYVAFTSGADTLIVTPTVETLHVFIHDIQETETTLVSVASDGSQGNGISWMPSLSGSGRYVVFESYASNLAPNDTNNDPDIYFHDRQTGETRRITQRQNGSSYEWASYAPAIASNGQSVVYYSASNDDCDSGVESEFPYSWVCWRDLATGTVETILIDGGGTRYVPNRKIPPTISADGRFVGFTVTRGFEFQKAYVWDRQNDQLLEIGRGINGAPADSHVQFPQFGHSEQYIAFHSWAGNLVIGDTNGVEDGFVIDVRLAKTPTPTPLPTATPTIIPTTTPMVPGFDTERVSLATDGTQGNASSGIPAISANGRWVAFQSDATSLVVNDTNVSTDIFLRDTTTEETLSLAGLGQGASPLFGDSEQATVSEDGNHIVFVTYGQLMSDTNDLLDVYYYDVVADDFQLVSRGMDGRAAGVGDDYDVVDITPTGETIAFATEAPLILTDTNGVSDIYVYDTADQTLIRSSVRWDGSQSSSASHSPSISGNGLYVAFVTNGQLDPFDSNGLADVYYSDRNGASYRISYSDIAPLPYDGNGPSFAPRFAKDGLWVTFVSDASNLIGGDTNGVRDTYIASITPLRSAGNRILERVSVSSAEVQANGATFGEPPAISADGRYVAFATNATNFDTGDTNNRRDLYLRDRTLGTTVRVSYRPDGQQYPAHDSYASDISNDGRYLSYMIDNGSTRSTMLYDRILNQTTRLDVDPQGNVGNDSSGYPSLSGTGSVATFISRADNFPGGSGLDYWHVYRRGITANTLDLISRYAVATTNDDSTDPSLSADGQSVVFTSNATNLLPEQDDDGEEDVYLYDRTLDIVLLVSADGSGNALGGNMPQVSGNGAYVAYQREGMIYRWERATNSTVMVSVSNSGIPGDFISWEPSISDNGRYVAFASGATNLVPGDTNNLLDIFVRDVVAGTTTRVSVAGNGAQSDGDSFDAALSADGRYVAFSSLAITLAPGEEFPSFDIFVHDRTTGETTRLTRLYDGAPLPLNGTTRYPAISADGRYVVFQSAERLVADDSPVFPWTDVYIIDRQTYGVGRLSVARDGVPGDGNSERPVLSANGLVVAYQSGAGNLVVGDTNNARDVFRTIRPVSYPPAGPTPTPIPTSSATPVVTITPTHTPTLIPTNSTTPVVTHTATSTSTPVPPSNTPLPSATLTLSPSPTLTATRTATPPSSQRILYLPLIQR
jgi:Tol biopolymer transport system component